jgi:hypothetical protein
MQFRAVVEATFAISASDPAVKQSLLPMVAPAQPDMPVLPIPPAGSIFGGDDLRGIPVNLSMDR